DRQTGRHTFAQRLDAVAFLSVPYQRPIEFRTAPQTVQRHAIDIDRLWRFPRKMLPAARAVPAFAAGHLARPELDAQQVGAHAPAFDLDDAIATRHSAVLVKRFDVQY